MESRHDWDWAAVFAFNGARQCRLVNGGSTGVDVSRVASHIQADTARRRSPAAGAGRIFHNSILLLSRFLGNRQQCAKLACKTLGSSLEAPVGAPY